MDKVLRGVVDAFELAVELQRVPHEGLHGAHPLQAAAAAAGLHLLLCAFAHRRADEFIKHGIVAAEAHVERIVVAFVGDVNGSDEIDDDLLRRFKAHDGRFEAVAFITLDEAHIIGGCLRWLSSRNHAQKRQAAEKDSEELHEAYWKSRSKNWFISSHEALSADSL